MRVRVAIDAKSILLHTLSDRLVASWAPKRLPEAFLVLESDKDYAAIRKISAGLWPIRARLWRLFGFAAVESGNRRGWPVLLLLIVALILALQYLG